ncbi:OmpA family protein [Brevundimonas sp. LjRoot202]|uniref:OmpA family protein n=1 Tax=Brevundimonas sp. LjRoot202 TaxID=3342281 RepID=UPI003ECEBCB4
MRRFAAVLTAVMLVSAPAAAHQEASAPLRLSFLADSDEVTQRARGELDDFARRYDPKGGMSVRVAGHATLGESEMQSPQYAVGLAQRRANNVRSYLVVRGVPDGEITTETYGASSPLDGRPHDDAANRRVEVSLQAGSGW